MKGHATHANDDDTPQRSAGRIGNGDGKGQGTIEADMVEDEEPAEVEVIEMGGGQRRGDIVGQCKWTKG